MYLVISDKTPTWGDEAKAADEAECRARVNPGMKFRVVRVVEMGETWKLVHTKNKQAIS